MNYQTDGQVHVLTLTKDEMISLVGILYEGLEFAKLRYGTGDAAAEAKLSDRQAFIDMFNRKVLSTEPKRDLVEKG